MNKENVSTVFLLPGIEIREELKDQFYSFGFQNTFLTCPPLTYPFPVLYLLFKPKSIDQDFIRFGEELHRNPNFLETIDAGKGKVVFIYRVPKRFRHDYELFLEGKYSKLSAEYKRCFQMEQYKLDKLGRHVVEGGKWVREYTPFYHVFYRTDHIKENWKAALGYGPDDHIIDDMEFFDKQNPDKETMDEELWLG